MIQALSKSVRISPRKLRIIAQEVKKMRISDALNVLTNSTKRGSSDIKKTLESAVSNAKNNKSLKQDDLVITKIEINAGPKFKRWHAVSKGSAHEYSKKTSHIRVVLDEIKPIKVESSKVSQKESVIKEPVKEK